MAAKKTRMGRDLNALLGGATRTRKPAPAAAQADSEPTPAQKAASVVTADRAPAPKPAPAASTPAPASSSTATSLTPGISTPAYVPGKVSAADLDEVPKTGDRVRMLGVDQIKRGSYQPRRHFDDAKLEELAESIRRQGVIQPILVRPYAGSFELIAGERRWRATQLAGIGEIPVIIREMEDQSVAAVSLIENIQRADLNPLEEAEALVRLCEEFKMTQQEVAESVGKSRPAVGNLMRLLDLHEEVKPLVDTGDLEMGHARALLGAPKNDQPQLARKVVKDNMTVRAVENMVRGLGKSKPKKGNGIKSDPNIDALGKKLGEVLGASVNIRHKQSGAGKLEISYGSVSELEGILSHIK